MVDKEGARFHLASTATQLGDAPAGKVIVCGSHGGAYAGYLIARSGARALILNDAGVGLDNAGLGALALAQSIGMAGATVDFNSARIGDAEDMYSRGRISYANDAAQALGCGEGLSCQEAVAALLAAALPTDEPVKYEEARSLAGISAAAGLSIVCVDSISLVTEADAGHIVVSGSHGAIVSSQPELVIKVPAALALYNDAGVGCDGAGLTRLPALNDRGVAAATVTSASARIGDAQSTLEDGVIGHLNALAHAGGIRAGMRAAEAVHVFKVP